MSWLQSRFILEQTDVVVQLVFTETVLLRWEHNSVESFCRVALWHNLLHALLLVSKLVAPIGIPVVGYILSLQNFLIHFCRLKVYRIDTDWNFNLFFLLNYLGWTLAFFDTELAIFPFLWMKWARARITLVAYLDLLQVLLHNLLCYILWLG